jgi:Domain of unknown function (DUF5916)
MAGRLWSRSVRAALLASPLALAAVARAEPPAIVARRVPPGEAVRIDGRLDDPAWSKAEWTTSFRQSVPHLGAAASEPTSVAFLFDDHDVYVALRCGDDPHLIRANKLRHRDDPTTDDHVEVIFDTYRDQLRGTVFVVNPLGAKEEGLVDGFERYTWSWDEVWDVRARITPEGWQAEMRIPLRILRYGPARRQVWGVNVERVIRRKQEDDYLVPPQPPFDISSLNYAADLTGLELGVRQRNLQLIPYVLLGGAREPDPAGPGRRSRAIDEVGLDLKYSLTSGLTLDATTNTDFAQVEADDQQVNLTRFSLFYPEKRGFFLENADLFSFGHFGGDPGMPDVTPFFSRRIGLAGGTTVPLDAGVRLTGKIGDEDVGVLAVRTGAVQSLALPTAWYEVARVRHDFGGRSYVGAIVTDSRRGGFHSATVGGDGLFYFTPGLSLRTDFLRAEDNSSSPATRATNLALDLTTDPWGFLFSWVQVDPGFDPDLGFVDRDDYRRKQALLRRSFRPDWRGIRRVSFRINDNWYDSLVHRRLASGNDQTWCYIELENGDTVQIQTNRSFERLFEPFELDPSVTFAPGSYTFTSTDVRYQADQSRRFGVDAEGIAGGFYDGRRKQLGGDAWVVFDRHLRAGGSYTTISVSTPHGDLDWRLWSARIDYIHSATMSASALLQYNSSTGTTVLNVRLRWILPNDSNLFLVVDDNREEPTLGPSLRTREIALKLDVRLFV